MSNLVRLPSDIMAGRDARPTPGHVEYYIDKSGQPNPLPCAGYGNCTWKTPRPYNAAVIIPQ